MTTFVELRMVAGRSRRRVGRPQAVSRRTCCAVALRRTAWSEHGTASVNQTRPHCVNQMGKTQSEPLIWAHAFNVTAYRNTVSWQCGPDSWPRNLSKVGYAVTLLACSVRCLYMAVASKGMDDRVTAWAGLDVQVQLVTPYRVSHLQHYDVTSVDLPLAARHSTARHGGGPWARHGRGMGTAWTRHGHGMGTAWARCAMCEPALRELSEWGGVWCGHRKTKVTSSGGKRCLFSFGRMWFCLLDWMRVENTNTVYSRI